MVTQWSLVPDSPREVGERSVTVRGTVNGTSPLTRPADTSAYSAKDTIADSTSAPHVWKFSHVARADGRHVTITKARLQTSQTSSLDAQGLRLHLYKVAPTAIDDNVACTAPLAADAQNYIGAINFPALAVEGSGADSSYAVDFPEALDALTKPDDDSLYGLLETVDGFTPVSAGTFDIYLTVQQD